MAEHIIFIVFVFALGACIGSFLNVVVYRIPREMSLIKPGSHCPQCDTPLAWYDNIPVFGWIFLGGKCRYCHKKISPRYPIVEAITGLLFVFYYVMFFIAHAGPCGDISKLSPTGPWFVGDLTSLKENAPTYFLDMALISGLLAVSIIDAELYIIPASIPWWIGGAAIVVHAIFDQPQMADNRMIAAPWMALSAGAAIGLLISIILLHFKIIPLSFLEGDLLEVERHELNRQAEDARKKGAPEPEIPPELTPTQIRLEMNKEMLFLIPPMMLGGISMSLYLYVPAFRGLWDHAAHIDWLSAGLGATLGGLIGGFVVWLARILGSYGFGREAMGLGDVHLMFGVGAVLGAGAATVAFFLAPFFGIAVAIYMFLTAHRRQLPLGPYLSLATAFLMLFYCPIAAYLLPGLGGLKIILHQWLGHV